MAPARPDLFYELTVDRFAHGDPSNDEGGRTGGPEKTGFDPTRADYFHAGALAGVTTRLDYLADRRGTPREYEAYHAMAPAQLARIGAEVARAHGLLGLACAHRLGRLGIGDTAVVLAVSSPHRKAALDAIDDFIVRMKRDVPIWKKEHFEGGAVWIGTPDDPQGVLARTPIR